MRSLKQTWTKILASLGLPWFRRDTQDQHSTASTQAYEDGLDHKDQPFYLFWEYLQQKYPEKWILILPDGTAFADSDFEKILPLARACQRRGEVPFVAFAHVKEKDVIYVGL